MMGMRSHFNVLILSTALLMPAISHAQEKDEGYKRPSAGAPFDSGYQQGIMERGYFFQAQANIGLELGISAINAYRLGRCGMLGLGVGVDWVHVPSAGNGLTLNTTGTNVPMIPMFIYYAGDLLARGIAPYYNFFAGYGVVATQPGPLTLLRETGEGRGITTLQGGPMAGGGIGVRFFAPGHHISFSPSLNLTVQNELYWNRATYYNTTGPQQGTTSYYYASGSVFMFIPTINLGIGLVK